MGLDPQIAGGFANAIAIFGDQAKGFSLEFITRVMPFSLNHNSLAEQISSANPIAEHHSASTQFRGAIACFSLDTSTGLKY
jgi:hypothetical protein